MPAIAVVASTHRSQLKTPSPASRLLQGNGSNPSSAVALLEFLAVATWARVVAADVFQGVAHRFLVGVAAVRAVHMAVVMIVIMLVMVMIVVAVRAMDMRLLGHRGHSVIKSAGIITPLCSRCT